MMVWVFFFFFLTFLLLVIYFPILGLYFSTSVRQDLVSYRVQGSILHHKWRSEVRANLNEHGTKEPLAMSSPQMSK